MTNCQASFPGAVEIGPMSLAQDPLCATDRREYCAGVSTLHSMAAWPHAADARRSTRVAVAGAVCSRSHQGALIAGDEAFSHMATTWRRAATMAVTRSHGSHDSPGSDGRTALRDRPLSAWELFRIWAS